MGKKQGVTMGKRFLAALLMAGLLLMGAGGQEARPVRAFTAAQRTSLEPGQIQVSRSRLLQSAAAHVRRGQQVGYGYNRVLNGDAYVPLASSSQGFCCVDLVTHVIYTATASIINGRYHTLEETLATAHSYSASNGLVFNTQAVSTLRSQLSAIPRLYQSLGGQVRPADLRLGDIVLTGYRNESAPNHSVLVLGKVSPAENAFMQIPGYSPETSYFINMSSSSTRASYQSATRFNTYWDSSDPNKGFYIKQVFRPLYATHEQDLGGFSLKKTDALTGAGLAGAVFLLTAPDGSSRQIAMTGPEYASGKVLRPGLYQLKEIQAPPGYQLDARERVLTIGFDTVNLDYFHSPITNTPDRGRVRLEKKEAGTGAPIAGAVFELSQSAAFPQASSQRLTTGADGSAVSGDFLLSQGATVYLREVSVPGPYLLDTSVRQVTLQRGSTVTAAISNDRAQGRIRLLKEEEAGGRPVPGAVFEVRGQAGDLVARLTTGPDGWAETAFLPLGRYQVTEVSVPPPLVLDRQPCQVDLFYQGPATPLVYAQLKLTNREARGRIRLTKTDAQDGSRIPGAVFEVLDLEGKVLEELVTDERGEALSGSLPLGRYRLVERSVPPPYLLDPTARDLELLYRGQTVPVVEQLVGIPNQAARGRLRLLKADALDGRPIEGATFEILDQEGEVRDLLITDGEGEALSNLLPLGTYFLREIEAVEGYLIDEEVKAFELVFQDEETPEVTAVMELANQPVLGSLAIVKRDRESLVPIEGAVFEVLDPSGEPALDYQGLPVPHLVTDAEGRADSPRMRYGRYLVREVDTPAAYYLDETVHELDLTGHGERVTLELFNDRVLLKVCVRKSDRLTRLPLEGAVFAVYRLQDEGIARTGKPDPVPVLDGLVTDEAGLAASSEALPVGDYRLVELQPPAGYTSGEDLFFSVSRDLGELLLEQERDAIELQAGNRPVEIEFNKEGPDGRPLAGARLALIDRASGQPVEAWVSEEEPHRVQKLLIHRDYLLRELEAPPGFALSPDLVLTVEDRAEVQRITMRNERTGLLIEKIDQETGVPLAGAVFHLSGLDGRPLRFVKEEGVYLWDQLAGQEGDPNLETDQEGKILLLGLPSGRWQLIEREVPEGYAFPLEPFDLALPTDACESEPFLVRLTNRKTRVVLLKIDRAIHRPLEGAVLEIFDQQGRKTGEGMSGKDGRLILEGLCPGPYTFREKQAPPGYIREEEPGSFTLEPSGRVLGTLVLTNRAESPPVTGDGSFFYYLLPALIATGAGLVLLVLSRRQGWRWPLNRSGRFPPG